VAKGIKRQLIKVSAKIRKELSAQAKSSYLKGALTYEGHDSGYLTALDDVLLALNGVKPDRNGWWE